MDMLRGKIMPIVLVSMAILLAVLGSARGDQASALAVLAQKIGAQLDPDAVAPRAQAEAKKRVLLKKAQAANIDRLAFYGGAALLFAFASLLVVAHLRAFRPSDLMQMAAAPGAGPPKS